MQSDPEFRAEILLPRADVAILDVGGDVDVYAGPQFKALLLQSIAQGTRHVIVDLTRATALDSIGLGILVSGAKQARRGSLAIVCANEAMTHLLAVVGLDRVFTMFASRTAALAAAD